MLQAHSGIAWCNRDASSWQQTLINRGTTKMSGRPPPLPNLKPPSNQLCAISAMNKAKFQLEDQESGKSHWKKKVKKAKSHWKRNYNA